MSLEYIEPMKNTRGSLCGYCDEVDAHAHQRIMCTLCGTIGLAENMDGPVQRHKCKADPSFYNPEYDALMAGKSLFGKPPFGTLNAKPPVVAGPGDCVHDMPFREPYALSFRDRCAIAAMQGLLAMGFNQEMHKELSEDAYGIADAMVAQRDKKP